MDHQINQFDEINWLRIPKSVIRVISIYIFQFQPVENGSNCFFGSHIHNNEFSYPSLYSTFILSHNSTSSLPCMPISTYSPMLFLFVCVEVYWLVFHWSIHPTRKIFSTIFVNRLSLSLFFCLHVRRVFFRWGEDYLLNLMDLAYT